MPEIDIRLITTAKNGILARFCDEVGGVKKAAEAIGVSVTTFYKWIGFHNKPGQSKASREIVRRLEAKTGRLEEDIFCLSQDEMQRLRGPRVTEKTIDIAMLEYANHTQRRLTSVDDIDKAEQNELLTKLVKSLSERERKIVEALFGMNGNSITTEELAEQWHVSTTRIFQIRDRALERLREWGERTDLIDVRGSHVQQRRSCHEVDD